MASTPAESGADVSGRFAEAVRHHQAGRRIEAESLYRAILADHPRHAESLNLLGVAAAQGGRYDEAVRAIAQAIAINGENAAFHNNLGETLRLQSRFPEAARAFGAAIVLAPGYAEAWNNLGVIRHAAGLLEEATRYYRRALDCLPNFPDALGNIGAAYQEQNRCDLAEVRYRQAIALRPDFAEAHNNLGMVLLTRGEFSAGWHEYEWRRRLDSFHAVRPSGNRPEWEGEDISGRTILLYGEQGLGDCLQFSRFATPIAARCAKVILQVHPVLTRLLSSVDGVAQVVAKDAPPPSSDVQLSLMSAPHRLGITKESIPTSVPYVRPDAASVEKWAERVRPLPGLKVGLAWAGDPRPYDTRANSIDRRRSMALAELTPLLALAGVSMVSLQKGEKARQISDIPPALRPLDWMDEISDFADTAALVANLDLVISVDTSVAHLAGAMGKPVWIASRFDGCWRWLEDRDDSPWYPSARLFRQKAPGDWTEVVTRIAATLSSVIEGHTPLAAAPPLPHPPSTPRNAPSGDDGKTRAKTLYAQGVALQGAGRPLDAEAAYRAALAADPNHAEAHNNLGNILSSQGRRDEALASLQKALAVRPDYAEAHYNRGLLFHKEGRLAEAKAAYLDALRHKGDFQEALINLGAALQEQNRPADAEMIQRACLAGRPGDALSLLNLSVAVKNQGRVEEALTANLRAVICQPSYALAHVNLGHILLLRGLFEEGWREYEWRWKGGTPGLTPRFPEERRWTGQDLRGRTLLFHAEQGLGDSLQFIRYAALFARAGASVIVECQAPLVRLFNAQAGIDRVMVMETGLAPFDFHLPMMSAPGALGTRLENIPAECPYIIPDATMAEAWGRRLSRLSGLKVGIVWAGSPRQHDYRLTAADRQRSIEITRLTPLLSLPGVSFVSLQKGDPANRIDDLPAELRPLDLMAEVSDFADTAALVANLDLVITVDTAVAHLAGAMGKPVWIASRFDGCWRWLEDRDDSPWYPSARLFRQKAPGDWTEVIGRIRDALAAHTGQTDHRPAPRAANDDATATRLLMEARTHHLSGRLAEAETGYRHLLAAWPDHPDGLHLLGAVALQTRRDGLAATLIRRFLALVPASPEGHNNLGNAYRAQGCPDAAQAAYHRALRLKANYPEALINLGKTWLDRKRPDEAERVFRQAIAARPLDPHAHYCLGVVLQEQGRPAEAATAYRAVLTLVPDDAQTFNNLGNALKDQDLFDQAIGALRTALLIRPGYWEALYNLGLAFQHHGRLPEAVAAYQAALSVHPDSSEINTNLGSALRGAGRLAEAEAAQRTSIGIRSDYPKAHNNLGIVLKEQGRLTEAVAAFRQALSLHPDYGEAYNNLAVTLMELRRPDLAIAAYRSAITCRPDDPEPQNNLGVTLHQMGRLEEAISAYDRAVLLNPRYAEALTNRGMAHLANGNDESGWDDYEWRWKGGLANLAERDFSEPRWQGEDLTGRTILLHGEQGFGDVIQFVRYAPLVAARGGTVVVEAYPPLARLLDSLDGTLRIVAAGDPLPPFDCHLPLMSLPHVMGTAIGTRPSIVPYLRATAEDVAAWRHRLAGLRKPRVGLVWAGNPRLQDAGAHAIDRRRSLPLSRLGPLLSLPGIDFVSVQTGMAAGQLDDVAQALRPADFSTHLGDFADTAGLLANLDLLISVDTAPAHLAGAMGKPVWILSRFDGCWRWGRGREDSPWYPTLRLFRQMAPEDWDGVVERVTASLRQWMD
ncbi:tetratricopeptide repeat protein [Telmatospirillum siberiense]|uniref:tetratricopeptide repeat protein n=1 Tax=Telmatospirillum siberiense TaxID=382514 RepID=UPI0013042562|nr:tetratricopeptide repeat protein [Telmatospirillum siberiense]